LQKSANRGVIKPLAFFETTVESMQSKIEMMLETELSNAILKAWNKENE